MNKILKNISSSVVIFTMIVSAFATPLVPVAHAQTTTGFPFELPGFDFPGFDLPIIDLPSLGGGDMVVQTCNLQVNQTQIPTGGNVTLTWNTSGFDVFTLNGQTISGNNGTIQMTNIVANTTYQLVAQTADGVSDCTASVTVTCLPPPADCRLEVTKVVDKATANVGDTLTYTITVKNTGSSDCTGSGVKIEDVLSDKLTYLTQSTSFNITPGYDGGIPVYTTSDRTLHFNGNVLNPGEQGSMTVTARVNTPATCGDFEVTNQARATALELNNFGNWASSAIARTAVNNDCTNPDPAPTCDSFTANPGTIVAGGQSTLAWQTSNASQVVINNSVGNVNSDGSVLVSPLVTTTYTLTAFGTQGRSATCTVPVTVSSDPIPVCEYFTATPNTLAAGGGQVTFNWKVNGATTATIAPTIGAVATQGSKVQSVTASTNFALTATDADGDQVTCTAPVTVAADPILTCADNVTFTASDYSIREGEDTQLNWSTSNVDSVSISGINSTALSGSSIVEPRTNTTYVLTARKGARSVDCPLTVAVDENNGGGGGGGGSSAPRCELTVSDNKIKSGEQITLTWDTSRATEVTIKDNKGKILMTTEKYSSKDKDEYYDGSLKLKPTRDTEYTLVAERGSKDRTCKVKVNVDDLTVLTDRDQKPLVAGISLSNVPYTGFEAGTMLTIMFYTLLAAWALFVTYLVVMRPRATAGVAAGIVSESISPSSSSMLQAEAIRPDVFTPSITAMAAATAAPINLPTGTPVIGYENIAEESVAVSTNPHHVSDEVVTRIENRAHTQSALLSSDAIRHFISTTTGTVERDEALDEVIASAKGQYPLEDGWIVINEARMRELCVSCTAQQTASAQTSFVPAVVPEGSSSLAEAIVTGNIVAAYDMIGNRPMFALADAAADLDAVIRGRRGETTHVSDLLANETAKLSEGQLKSMVTALTSAIDGTYTDEASAVKMAIMKAVKEVA